MSKLTPNERKERIDRYKRSIENSKMWMEYADRDSDDQILAAGAEMDKIITERVVWFLEHPEYDSITDEHDTLWIEYIDASKYINSESIQENGKSLWDESNKHILTPLKEKRDKAHEKLREIQNKMDSIIDSYGIVSKSAARR